jgi:hypothetical protein
MSPQIHFALECLVTETTREGLVARVFPHVCDEVGRLAECFPAHYAFVGLLAWKQKIATKLQFGLNFIIVPGSNVDLENKDSTIGRSPDSYKFT